MIELERCHACGSAFFPDFSAPAYENVWGGNAALDFYQEQGAGIDVMLASLYAVPHGTIRSFLEIGCGFGFSVDFASRVLGWKARGMDPGPAARLGRQLLEAQIEPAYLTSDSALELGTSDLLLCSEVIEHVADPDPFLAVLAANLARDGTILLTTPNAAAIRPGTSPATLMPLLSAGYHLVIFSPAGLRSALERAGFETVVVDDWGHSLRAGACHGAGEIDFGRPLDRKAYRGYLEIVAARAEPGSALSIGMYGRLLKEMVNAGEYDAAETALAPLRAALKDRWDLDLDAPQTMPLAAATPSSLEDLHRTHPFNLGTILHHMGTLGIVQGRPQEATARFEAAVKAADRVRSVLRAIGSDDGETEDLGWRSRAALIRLAAERQPDRAAAALERFSAEATGLLEERAPAAIVEEARRNVFVSLVNGGHYKAADALASSLEKSDLPQNHEGISVRFALGILELNHRNSPVRAAQNFAAARAVLETLSGPPHRHQSFIWALRYHEGLAALKARDREAGRAALLPLLEPSSAYGEPDPSFVDKARALGRDHGLIRRG